MKERTLALQVTLDLELFLAFVLNALVVSLVDVALVLTDLIVVGVVAVTVLANHFASVFLLLQLHLGVSIDKVHHVDDVSGWLQGKG